LPRCDPIGCSRRGFFRRCLVGRCRIGGAGRHCREATDSHRAAGHGGPAYGRPDSGCVTERPCGLAFGRLAFWRRAASCILRESRYASFPEALQPAPDPGCHRSHRQLPPAVHTRHARAGAVNATRHATRRYLCSGTRKWRPVRPTFSGWNISSAPCARSNGCALHRDRRRGGVSGCRRTSWRGRNRS